MATLVSAVVTDLQGMFNDITPAKALTLFNASHAEICRLIKLYPDDTVLAPYVANVRVQPFDKDILAVKAAYSYAAANSFLQLLEFHDDQADYLESGWRGQVAGLPYRWFQDGFKFGVDPTPNSSSSTFTVTAATNATPIVVTTSAVHGLAAADDGTHANAVTIWGAVGNTAANGSFYAKRTGYSTTTFALYQDVDLTIPVAGNGAWSSGGTVITTACYPYVKFTCAKRHVLATTDSLPEQVIYHDAWLNMASWLHAEQKHRDQLGDIRPQLVLSLNRLSMQISGRPLRLKPETVMNVPLIRH